MPCVFGQNFGVFAKHSDVMNPEVAIDVVIVNHNAGDVVVALVDQLLANDALNVSVVDNASTDGSLSRLQSKDLSLQANPSNLGFAAASNQGVAMGQATVIALVNPDCQVTAAQLNTMALRLKEPGVGLVGCQVVNIDGSTQQGTWRRLPTLWRVLKTVTRLEKMPGFNGLNLNRPPTSFSAVNGACFVISRSLFESLGGFDEGYPLHFEDLDLFIRLQEAGKKMVCEQSVVVKHIKGLCSTDSKQVAAWKKAGLLRYFEKHRPRWEQRIIRWLAALK